MAREAKSESSHTAAEKEEGCFAAVVSSRLCVCGLCASGLSRLQHRTVDALHNLASLDHHSTGDLFATCPRRQQSLIAFQCGPKTRTSCELSAWVAFGTAFGIGGTNESGCSARRTAEKRRGDCSLPIARANRSWSGRASSCQVSCASRYVCAIPRCRITGNGNDATTTPPFSVRHPLVANEVTCSRCTLCARFVPYRGSKSLPLSNASSYLSTSARNGPAPVR